MRSYVLFLGILIFTSCATSSTKVSDCGDCKNYLTSQVKEEKEILNLLRDFTHQHAYDVEDLEVAVFPIRFVLMNTPGYKNKIKSDKIEEALEVLNDGFKTAKISFELSTINLVETDYYIEDFNAQSDLYRAFSLGDEKRNPDMLNVYIMMNDPKSCKIEGNVKRCSRVDGLSDIGREGPNNIVVSEFSITNKKTLIHEMGHFFGLRHTFDKSNGKEKADGSNCEIAGDMLCSTPADPDEMFFVNFGSCEMVGNSDLTGEYKPIINNYMNYYYPCHMMDFTFTDQQNFIMNQMAHSSIKNKLQDQKKFGL